MSGYDTDEYVDNQPNGWWARVRRLWGTEDPPEDGDEDEPSTVGSRSGRADHRAVQVSVRLNASAFNDARAAADGLKAGQQQIVNLERAPAPIAERILDYLCGVTYALDGTVERLGDKVFLFAPASVNVQVDGGTDASLA